MSRDRRVVVKGDGKNLYKISEYDGWFYAYQVDVGFISNDNNSIGKARSLVSYNFTVDDCGEECVILRMPMRARY